MIWYRAKMYRMPWNCLTGALQPERFCTSRFRMQARSKPFPAPPGSGLSVVSLAAEDGSAFASGCYAADADKGYITFVAVRPDRRRQGIGRAILRELEQRLAAVSGGMAKRFEIIFFNPMNFVWTVPGTDGHEHPNAPGVDVAGEVISS